jgi:hypothetical protein
MGEAVEASADMLLGEAFDPAAMAHARIYRGGFVSALIFALAFGVGISAGTFAGVAIAVWDPVLGDWATIVLGLAGAVLGFMLGLRLYSRRHLRGILASLSKMGSPPLFPTRFRFEDEAIHVDSERVSHRVAWSAVLFVAPSREHWLVQADTLTLAVPRRAFADAAAEQALLDLAEASLSEEARSRSVFKSH